MARTHLHPTALPGRSYLDQSAPPPSQPRDIEAVTRLGLYGGTRQRYGSFSGKTPVLPTRPTVITALGVSATPSRALGPFTGKTEAADPSIAGDITVNFNPTASSLTFTVNSNTRTIVADVTTTVTPAASNLLYNTQYGLVGDVEVVFSPAATLTYNLNADVQGSLTTGFDPTAASLAYTANESISGDVTLVTIPAATRMEYRAGVISYSISGIVTVLFTIMRQEQPTITAGISRLRGWMGRYLGR